MQVVGSAANGRLALRRIEQDPPDAVTLDLEMPEMDGLETLRELRRLHPGVRVIMCSTLTGRGAEATLEALARGADDYVTKAANASPASVEESVAALRSELVPKIRQLFCIGQADAPDALPAAPASGGAPRRTLAPMAVVVAVSTGGPAALEAVVPRLPAGLPVPVLVVQHMPPVFTRMLADRLNSLSPLRVGEAVEGDRVEAGRVLVAPGDFHMRLRRVDGGVVVALDRGPQENSCRPAADALFRSAAEVYGGAALAVVLTGMGHDGLAGAERLRSLGAHVVAQDEATSVVWGMPGAVVAAGLADSVVPLDAVPAAILGQVQRGRGTEWRF
jgi:two-component system chemotaxis response regulator CheB